MRRTTGKIKTQIHLMMTDYETLAYAHCKHLLVDTFIGLLAMVDSDSIQSCIYVGNVSLVCTVQCAMMQTMSL